LLDLVHLNGYLALGEINLTVNELLCIIDEAADQLGNAGVTGASVGGAFAFERTTRL